SSPALFFRDCAVFSVQDDTFKRSVITLSLHDALPIYPEPGALVPDADHLRVERLAGAGAVPQVREVEAPEVLLDEHPVLGRRRADRKSTRLNSSHVKNSYADICLKK